MSCISFLWKSELKETEGRRHKYITSGYIGSIKLFFITRNLHVGLTSKITAPEIVMMFYNKVFTDVSTSAMQQHELHGLA